MNDLELFMAESARAIDATLDGLVPRPDVPPQRLHEAIRWSLFGGGKRFRPVLVFAVGEAFGAERESLLRTAGAVEMIHTYSLIHDDLPSMDNDDLRRGRETCHKRFDEATAILAGDALQALSFQTIADTDALDPAIRMKLLSKLGRAAAAMVAGQQMDLEAEGGSFPKEHLENIHLNKTGALIAFSAEAGAIIGGGSKDEIGAVRSFGEKLGLLFQITDDVLDITQTTETLGKTAAKDITARKATYPSVYGLERTNQLVNQTHSEAIDLLKSLDRPIDLLQGIANFLLRRNS